MRQNFGLNLLLIAVASAWGLSNPLAKIAVSTGYRPLGVMFWQLAVILLFSGGVNLWRHRRLTLPRHFLGLFIGIAIVGTLLPDYLLYLSVGHMSAGVFSILLAMVPVFSLPMALLLGFEKAALGRLAGVGLGALAIVVMIAPQSSLPASTELLFVALCLLAAACYAAQGNFLTWHGAAGLDALQILFGASVVAMVLVAPAALVSDQFIALWRPWDLADWAVLGTSVLHALAYGGFFALVARGGPVFAAQAAYLVTATGVGWSMLLLGERYSLWVWLSFALLIVGLLLVQPKRPPRVRL